MGVADGRATTHCSGRSGVCLGVTVALIALIGAFATAGEANAGELAYKGCITGDSDHPTGPGACTAIPSASRDGIYSGLGPALPLVSPDGGSLYAASGTSCFEIPHQECEFHVQDAVGRFAVDAKTGTFKYRDCLTGATQVGPSGSGACAEIPTATESAWQSGLGSPKAMIGGTRTVAMSPDGRSLYLSTGASECDPVFGDCPNGTNAVARFDRDPATGALTWKGCITGDTRSGPSGSGACGQIPTATEFGNGSGLGDVRSIMISADGRSLYTASPGEDAIVHFNRNPATGALTYKDCVAGTDPPIPGCEGGLHGLIDTALSPDGRSLYATTDTHESGRDFILFDRDPATGNLTRACLAGRKPNGSCAPDQLPSRGVWYLAVSPDDKSVYTSSGPFVDWFDRDPSSGALVYRGCIVDGRSPLPCAKAGGPISGEFLTASPDGKSVYTSGAEVTHFRRDLDTGKLKWADCITGNASSGAACNKVPRAASLGASLAAGPDGSLYTAWGTAVSSLALAPKTVIRGGPKGKSRRHRAVFKFHAGERSTFECKLKGRNVKPKLRDWQSCGSDRSRRKGRHVYRGLRSGRKVFKVRATDDARTTDPTPAKRRWRVG